MSETKPLYSDTKWTGKIKVTKKGDRLDFNDQVWVAWEDYLALQTALREALDGWRYAIMGFGPEPHDLQELDKFLKDLDGPSKRIEFLRAQFLDDK